MGILKKSVAKYLILCLMLSACYGHQDQKLLYLAHSLPTSHPVHNGILDMQRLLNEKSGGKLQIKVFPDGQLGNEREVLELLQIGSIAMTKVSAAAMSNFAPEYKITNIPYLFNDSEHLFSILEGEVGKQLLESGTEYLLRGLCFYDAGSRGFYSKEKPIQTPNDLEGMKIRVMNDQMSVDMVNALGGSATPMAYGELYTALQQGVVDGAENNIPSFVTSNHYEICKNYTFDEHTMVPDVIVIGTKFWNKLNETEKNWLQEAANESVAAQKKYWQQTIKENMELLKKANVNFINADKTKFQEKAKPVLDRFMQDPKMKELVEKIQQQ